MITRLELTTGNDLDLSLRSSTARSIRLDLLNNIHAFNDFAENDMLSVQMRSRNLYITHSN